MFALGMEQLMFDFILYFSLSNKTKQIAESFDLPVVEIHEELPEFNRIIIICPTYGDEELPPAMENFLDATPKVDWGCLKNWKDQLFLKFKN